MSIPVFPSFPGLTWPVMRSILWKTLPQPAISGKETRIPLWSFPRYQWELSFDLLRQAAAFQEWQNLIGFINSVGGSALPFYYDDPNDHAVTAQGFGTGDGATKDFQLVRALGGYAEPVQSPKAAPSIYVAGVLQTSGYTISSAGIVSFASAPAGSAALTWTGGFYWLCRFDDDKAQLSNFMSGLHEMKKLTFTSVKL